jgi:hypothetical protein
MIMDELYLETTTVPQFEETDRSMQPERRSAARLKVAQQALLTYYG